MRSMIKHGPSPIMDATTRGGLHAFTTHPLDRRRRSSPAPLPTCSMLPVDGLPLSRSWM